MSQSERQPEVGVVASREGNNAVQLIAKRPPEGRPACKPSARLTPMAGEGLL